MRDLIFVFYGGAMNGVFGGGVVKTLQKHNLYNRIHSIYGISAGAHSAAYFLSRKSVYANVYYDDLIGENFVKNQKKEFIKTLFKHFFNKRKRIRKIVDLDYLAKIEKHHKKLNLKQIKKSKIKLFIKVFDIKDKKPVYLKGFNNLLLKLKASSATIPFYPHTIKIGKKEYCDAAALSEMIDSKIKELINSNKKIIFVINKPLKSLKSFNFLAGEFIWTLLLIIYFKKWFPLKKLRAFNNYVKFKKYAKKDNVFILDNDIDIPLLCTQQEKLIELCKHGEKRAEEFLIRNKLI